MNILVVPSIRENNLLEFLNQWDDADWQIVIVEDNPTRTFRLTSGCHHVSWKEIDEDLGDNAWIISRRDSAIRCYGYLLAARLGANYIFTLDDDCRPDEFVENFLEKHLATLLETPRWFETVPGFRTRGIPYINRGICSNIVLNVGLWKGEADVDAITTLSGKSHKNLPLPKENRLVPYGQYFPLCGMNLCFKKEILPLMYFPLMGQGQPYARFDDIWCGLLVKKICDHLGLNISVGEPYIYHEKSSDPIENLVKEAPGVKVNEDLWQMIDNCKLSGSTPAKCMNEMAHQFLDSTVPYLETWGKAILIWTNLCSIP